jgi:hypothetical protein
MNCYGYLLGTSPTVVAYFFLLIHLGCDFDVALVLDRMVVAPRPVARWTGVLWSNDNEVPCRADGQPLSCPECVPELLLQY